MVRVTGIEPAWLAYRAGAGRSGVAHPAPPGTHDLRLSRTRRSSAHEKPCCVRVFGEAGAGTEPAWPARRGDPCRGGVVQAWYIRPRQGPMSHVSAAADGHERAKILAV